MDNPNCNTKRPKGQHLAYEERVEIVTIKTLYNYVDASFMNTTNMDLPEKLSRNTKTKKARENKKKLCNSIEECPEEVELREEFGHREIDSLIGKKGYRVDCNDACWIKT